MCSDLRRITVYRALKGNVSLKQCTAIDNNLRIVARWGINITKKKGRVKSSTSSEEGRTPVGQFIFQRLNESGRIAAGPLRVGGMEAGRDGEATPSR